MKFSATGWTGWGARRPKVAPCASPCDIDMKMAPFRSHSPIPMQWDNAGQCVNPIAELGTSRLANPRQLHGLSGVVVPSQQCEHQARRPQRGQQQRGPPAVDRRLLDLRFPAQQGDQLVRRFVIMWRCRRKFQVSRLEKSEV
jgi:hypothetical protein